MGTCTKCGRELVDNDLIYWKCTKCGKVFTASLLKLKNLWKQKQEHPRQALLKCSGCRYVVRKLEMAASDSKCRNTIWIQKIVENILSIRYN